MGFSLIPLPCGCVVEVNAVQSVVDGYVECPWCLTSFCGVELHDWFEAGAAPTILIEQARPLLNFADQLLEIVSRCGGCGSFIVREHGEREEIHLNVPADNLHFIRN